MFSVQNYYIYYGSGREPLVNLGFIAMLTCMVAIGLAIGVTIAVGGLLIIQVVIFVVFTAYKWKKTGKFTTKCNDISHKYHLGEASPTALIVSLLVKSFHK